MMHNLRVLFMMTRMNFMANLVYRLSFIISIVGNICVQFFMVMSIELIFRVAEISSMGGWQKQEILLLVANLYFMTLIYDMLVSGIWEFSSNISSGDLDFDFIRPVNPRISTHLRYTFDIWTAVSMIPQAAFYMYLFRRFDYALNPAHVALFFLMIVIASVMIYVYLVILGSISFWTDKSTKLLNLMFNAWEAGQYPREIFPKVLGRVFTWVIPIMATTYLPTTVLLGKATLLPFLELCGVTVLFFLISILVWRRGIQRYASASS